MVSAWIDLGLGLSIAESFETCMDVFSSFYQLSAGRRSTKETMMSSNLFLFSVAVKLENSVDSRERYLRDHIIALKISHLISNTTVQTESR